MKFDMPASSPNVGPIFILASGQRCGSTLIQRFLCTHPDILIWGEHDGVLRQILPGFQRLYEWNDLFGHHYEKYLDTGVARNFIANMNPPAAVISETLQQLFHTYWREPVLQLGKHIWGFKEVLYDAHIARQLMTLFPDARVIFITRHPFNCFTSMLHEERLKPGETYVPLKEIWTRSRTIEALNFWININRSFLETPDLDESRIFRLKYEQIVADSTGTMNRLVRWLKMNPDDFDFSLLDYKIYTDRHSDLDDRPVIQWSDLSAEEYTLLTADEVLHVTRMLDYEMPEPRPRKGHLQDMHYIEEAL